MSKQVKLENEEALIVKDMVMNIFSTININGGQGYILITAAKNFIATLDKSSQIVLYHAMSGYPKRITSSITSFDEAAVAACLKSINQRGAAFTRDFASNPDLNSVIMMKNLIKDLKENKLDDAEISAKHVEEIAVVKMLRKILTYNV